MKPRILLLEDDLVLRDFLASSLMSAKYEVIRVSQPQQALTLMDMTPFDLAIFDGGLPDMDGVETMREARARGFEGKFILISANPDRFIPSDEEHKQKEALGILRIFKKPFQFDELVDYIEELGDTVLSDLKNFATDDSLTQLARKAPEPGDATTVANMNFDKKINLNTVEPEVTLNTLKIEKDANDQDMFDLQLDLPDWLNDEPVLEKPKQTSPPTPLPFYEADSGDELKTNLLKVAADPLVDLEIAEESLSSQEDEGLQLSIATPPKQPAIKASAEFNQRLEEMKRDYNKKLEKQMCELVLLLAPIRQEQTPEALDEAIHITHKLRGTSGTFGFQEVSQTTGWLEDKFCDLRDGKITLSSQHWEEIFTRIEHAILSQR